ncbi:hypothetical protein ES288_A10G158000v1 [Gossypium darwinii]|uniref:Uncharacterized protein n=2 Tax=Gossypium TaxID=3633 RepID=A0A5D2NR23_GOSTO|nr:hypothetical protein ES288_A10G158000v1 [Gossypium darwinii]TYI06402.1 hypothetical protein ES332_A10G156900v1 [Gossypium tomentosum]
MSYCYHSLLCPPSSTTNTYLTVKERNEVIHRNLISVKPPPCFRPDRSCHRGGGYVICPPYC